MSTAHRNPNTVFGAFAQAARDVPDGPFLHVPASAAADYAPAGVMFGYGEALSQIEALTEAYATAGYGHGHRVALLLENRPAFILHWLALNALGVAVVPINPHYGAGELEHLIVHSDPALVVALAERTDEIRAAVQRTGRDPASVMAPNDEIPAPHTRPPLQDAPSAETVCALLYTSGTTGKPKACRLTNEYFATIGRWYLNQGGLCAMTPGEERLLTPLPLFHMNAMACSFMAVVLSRSCLIQLDRFHPTTWWDDVAESETTIFHYLGIMPAILLTMEPSDAERRHRVKFGFGANVDPAHHEAFEARFGVPLVEAWAMTETGGGACIAANRDPRHVGTRCFGLPRSCEVRVVDEDGRDVRPGEAGEMLVRHSAVEPRKGFFAGYHEDEVATEAAWAGGWFHTGDIVRENKDGSLCFVDRRKNIIRRAGENIAALEVEAVIAGLATVAQVAVVAVPDELRGEEVMACVVPADGTARSETAARAIVTACLERLAYYKAPGYVLFLDQFPATATQKVQKLRLQELVGDAQVQAHCHDLRSMKRPRKRSEVAE